MYILITAISLMNLISLTCLTTVSPISSVSPAMQSMVGDTTGEQLRTSAISTRVAFNRTVEQT